MASKVRYLRTKQFLEENPEVGEKSLRKMAAELGAIRIGRRLLWPEDALARLAERQNRERPN